MGLAANKLIPVGVAVMDVPSLDTKGHNVVEKIRRIEPGLFWYERNEVSCIRWQLRSTQSCGPSSEGENL
jgi:hypothetical protein